MKKTIFAAITLTASITANAGGGMGGGSTEITQMLNNTELVASTMQEANLNATALEQYITQVSQLARMDKNLLKLPIASIQSQIGGEWSNVGPFVQAYKAATNLSSAATTVFLERMADIDAMRAGGLSPGQYYTKAGKAANARQAYFVDAEATELLHMQQLQQRAKAVEDLNAQVPEIDGNVKGFQHLALQAGRTQALMIDQQRQYSQMMQLELQREQDAAQRKTEGADTANSYDQARQAEKAGLAGALSYPKKP